MHHYDQAEEEAIRKATKESLCYDYSGICINCPANQNGVCEYTDTVDQLQEEAIALKQKFCDEVGNNTYYCPSKWCCMCPAYEKDCVEWCSLQTIIWRRNRR